MKKAAIIYCLGFLIIIFSLHCTNTKKEKTFAKYQWQTSDSLLYVNQLIDSFYTSTQTLDTNKAAVYYKKVDDTIDVLATNKTVDKSTIMKYYDIFLQNFSPQSLTDSFFIKKKNRVLQIAMYYGREFDDYTAVVKYYKQLISAPYKYYIPKEKLIDRMLDVGIVYNKIGDAEKTEQTYLATLALAKEINSKENEAKSIVNLNVILDTKQLYDSIIQQSIPLLNANYNIHPKIKSSLRSSIANAYLQQNNFDLATRYANNSIQLLQSSLSFNNPPTDYDKRLGGIYKTIANIAAAKKDLQAADKAYSQAAQAYIKYDSTNRDLGKLYLQIAKHKTLYTNSIFSQPAIFYINKALATVADSFDVNNIDALPHQVKDENTMLDALLAKANNYQSTTTFDTSVIQQQKVLACLKKAFEVEKLLLNSFEYDNSKMNFINESYQYTQNAVAICYKLYTTTNNKHWINEALQFIENNKATVLLAKLKQNNFLQQLIKNDTITKQIVKLKSEKLLFADGGNKQKLIELEKQIDALTITLEQQYPQLKQQDVFSNDVAISAIQKNLNNKTAFIDYLFVDNNLYSIVVEKDNAQFTKKIVAANEIQQYKTWCGDLGFQQTAPAQFFNTSFQLYNNLFPQKLNTKTNEIIIATDGILNNFNFESLINKPYQNLSNITFMAQQYIINYCYSYTTLIQKLNESDEVKNILVCTPASVQKLRNQEQLQYTATEAQSIKTAFKKTEILDDKNAIANDFIKKYNNYDIVHLATHATKDSIIGNSIIDFYDKTILANQLQENNTINTKLFFLSACETSLGKNTNTEGALSLARSIYYAGAQNVIASQWKINDATTAQLVNHFYTSINNNKFAKALHLAKNKYLLQNNNEKKLPYYWASLVSIGFQDEKGFNNYYWIALLGIILFFFATVFLLKKRLGKRVKLLNLKKNN